MNTKRINSNTVLVIDDEIQIRRLLRITLETNGYKVFDAENGQNGLVEAASRKPDIIILDLGLPDIDGTTVIKRLREWTKAPILILSVRERDEDKISALDNGADDYITKPFSTAELLARLRVAIRHMQPVEDSAIFRGDDFEVDFVARTVTVRGKQARLTSTEYSLLCFLVRHSGKVLTHHQVLKEVWGPNSLSHTHYLRVYMARLREKIETDPSRPVHLITEPGVGYRFVSSEP